MAFLKKSTSKKNEKTETTAAQSALVTPRSGLGNKTGVLLHPHITEKTSLGAASSNKKMYAFAVSRDANKSQVKHAVESRYGVQVATVRMVHIRGKEIHRGKQTGWKQGMKKAYATLAQGQTIEIQ